MTGGTMPSYYLDDNHLSSKKFYGFNLFSGLTYMDWVEKHIISPVVLVSYGTVSNYDATQLDENRNGLCNSNKPFFGVVRSNKAHKLSVEFKVKCANNGLIVAWCPQL